MFKKMWPKNLLTNNTYVWCININSLTTRDETTMLTLLQGKNNGQWMDFVKDADYDTLNI